MALERFELAAILQADEEFRRDRALDGNRRFLGRGVHRFGPGRDTGQGVVHGLDEGRQLASADRIIADIGGNDVRRHFDDLGSLFHLGLVLLIWGDDLQPRRA